MDLKKHVLAQIPSRPQDDMEPPMSGQFDPKELRLTKRVPERSDAEKSLSQRLMSGQKSPPAPSTKVTPNINNRPPLGLPPGSVRALLCLMIVAFLVIQTARGVRVDVVWSEALMIMLAHYFTTRRFVPLSNDLRARLEASGEIEPDESPLYLPKHSVRILLIAAFAGLASYLYEHGRLFEPQSLSLLVSVGAYLLGITVRGCLAWWSHHTGLSAPEWWVDLKAISTLLIVLVAILLQLVGAREMHGVDTSRLQDFSLGLVLYYFGSR
jgi:hypothetical protein